MKKYLAILSLCTLASCHLFASEQVKSTPLIFTTGIEESPQTTNNRWVKLFAEDNANEVSKKQFIQKFTAQYESLFKSSSHVNRQQFVDFELEKFDQMMQSHKGMSVKQAHVRFNVLDGNKDQKLTLKEFQDVGLKTFDSFDKKHDGVINDEDIKLDEKKVTLHGGASFKSPVSMPMATDTTSFIEQYGEGKGYVTLAMYLTAREKQYVHMDISHNWYVTEDAYVNEFTQRYDEHALNARSKMKSFDESRFDHISHSKTTIDRKDIKQFATQLFQYWDKDKTGKIKLTQP
ncbi:hypothetical protein [Acinetobacter nectaris]|uniref:hypothetical protein n=1 Tax=Acinetobacter nectaris TaxID=1219382 RepID=UPI001F1C2059|nr:hypothetical protein [Acinetobacter nectaris]MCF9033973.1 hypothetical protein [Acinetobacter nectaris]